LSKAWFTSLSQALLNIGFNDSQVDTFLFIYHVEQVHMFLLVYVDEIIVTGNHGVMNKLIGKLQADFAIKDLDSLEFFLGVQANRDTTGLHLKQSKYVIDLLHRTQIANSKLARTHYVAGSKMSKFDCDLLSNPTEY
jgi:hypothetical protein